MTRMTLLAAISALALGALSACHSMGSSRDSSARGGTSMSTTGEIADRGSHPQGATDPDQGQTRGRY
jgi:hypothetical protein